MPLNVGVVGCGDIALKNYLPGTKALAGTVDIFATADTRYDRAVTAAEEGVISSTGRGGTFRLYQREEGGRYARGWSGVDPEGNVVATGAEAGRASGQARGGRRGENAPSEDVAHWAECIAQGKKPVLSAEHARHVVEIVEKAVVSSQTGQAQELTTTF